MTKTLWSVHQRTGLQAPVEDLEEILNGQRARFVATFSAFGADRWLQPTRCSAWDAHTVLRHVADAAEVHLSGFTGTPAPFVDPSASFDPQTTPDEWLAQSAEDSPAATIERYDVAMQEVCNHALAGLRAGADRATVGPYGPAHWSVITVHILWDAWLHERDILLVDQLPEPAEISGSANEQRLMALYATLMATVPGAKLGQPVFGAIEFTGDLALRARFDGTDGELCVSQTETDSADLCGELLTTIDSLGGRGKPLADVLSGPKELVESFAILGSVI